MSRWWESKRKSRQPSRRNRNAALAKSALNFLTEITFHPEPVIDIDDPDVQLEVQGTTPERRNRGRSPISIWYPSPLCGSNGGLLDFSPFLRLMKKLRRKPKGGERLSFDAIADRLNELGTPTRTRARWRGPTVWGIMRRA